MRSIVYRALISFLLLLTVGACAPAAPTSAPTKPGAPSGQATAAPPAAASAAPAAPVAPTPTAAAKIKRGGTLRFGLINDLTSFDSHEARAGNTPTMMLYDTLIDYKQNEKGTLQPFPQLATEWDVKENSVTFKLRKGVKFHDGSDFNAQVAKWNIDRMRTWTKSRQKVNLEAVTSVDVVDDYTVKLNLKTPSAILLLDLSNGTNERPDILSQAAMEKLGDAGFLQKPSGSGPMQFQEAVNGDHYTLKRFDGYWMKGVDDKPLPYLDSANYRLLTDDTVRTVELRTGNIDISETVLPKDLESVKANPDLEAVDLPWQGSAYALNFNIQSGPFSQNVKLRQAAAYALDRDSIAKVLGYGSGQGAKGPRLPGSLGYDAAAPYYWYDPAKAKQLLAEAGFEKGFQATLMVHDRTVDQQQAQMLKQQLDNVGITTVIDVSERTANIKRRESGLFEFLTAQPGQTIEPDKQYTVYWACDASSNLSRYCNPEFDRWLKVGRTTIDDKKRQEAYAEVAKIFYNDVPATYIWSYSRVAGIRKWVKNYSSKSLDYAGGDLRSVWLDK